MSEAPDVSRQSRDALVDYVRAITPARLFLDGSASSYTTSDLLRLRADHAAARDAVAQPFATDVEWWRDVDSKDPPVHVRTLARDHTTYLRRPDLGRRMDDDSRTRLAERYAGPPRTLCVAVAGGLSAQATHSYGPALLAAISQHARRQTWTQGPLVVIDYARVGLLNDLGIVTRASVVVLLIGERPGLAVADSLSAYLAYRPRPTDTDAHRNLVAGIHERGVSIAEAAERVADLISGMLSAQRSGVALKAPDRHYDRVLPPSDRG